MVFYSGNAERSCIIYASGLNYRYEFDENNQQSIVVVKNDSKEILVLMPQQKMAIRSAIDNSLNKGNDPLKSFENSRKSEFLVVTGKETINGIECVKSVLMDKDYPTKKTFTMWYSEKYQFPIKMINHLDGSKDTSMELKDIESWIYDPSYFSVPEGYRLMDFSTMLPSKQK